MLMKNRGKSFTGILIISLFLSITLHAQDAGKKKLTAWPVEGKIDLNGILDEPEWYKAPHATNFIQRELHEGEPATEKTEVAVLYDKKNLYIGAWCFDSQPDKIIANRMKRDFEYEADDNFKVIFDTYGDNRTAYLFITNPNAARFDAMISHFGESYNVNWDGVWNVKTTKTDEGWFVEMEIPLSTLRFKKGEKQEWGINFERVIQRKREEDLWEGWSRDGTFTMVSRAGKLTGLSGLNKISLVELKPYGIAGVGFAKDENPKILGNIGGDINYLITPTLKLNITLNTDFAQVESDRMQVNLTRFSLYYPEKREFFLEGKNYYNFGLGHRMQPFYSRRIGLAEDHSVIPIIAGARVMGKAGKTSIGAMTIQTAKKDTIPTVNYSVLRVKQDVLKESSVGFIAISKLEPGRENYTYGADFTYFTSHFRKGKNVAVGGAVAQTYTSDKEQKTGTAGKIYVDYPNDFIDFYATWEYSSLGFNPEVGYQRRTNYQMYNADMRIMPRIAKIGLVKKFNFKPFDFNYFIDNATHKMQSLWSEFRLLGFETKSGEEFEFNLQRKAENLTKPFEIHDGVVIEPGEYWFTDWELQFSTFDGRKLYGGLFVNRGGFYNGNQTITGTQLALQPNRFLKLSGHYARHAISLPAGAFTVHEFSGRIDFALSPDLFGSSLIQWNNEEDAVLINFRVNWIPKPGTNLYFVVNQGYDTENKTFVSKYTTVQLKLIWRFVL